MSDAQACKRCGACCEKGGPAFHTTDRALVEEGVVHTRYLYTIRRGERVRDNVRDALITAEAEIIKIKGREDRWTCHFYDARSRSCAIYEQRPLECRELKCWDTEAVRRIYDRDRLQRRDLLAGIEGLWSLVEDHEKRCSHEKLARAVKDLEGGFGRSALTAVMQMVRYDEEIRRLVVEKGNMEAAMTDFLFGRPLAAALRTFGYRVKKTGGAYTLAKA